MAAAVADAAAPGSGVGLTTRVGSGDGAGGRLAVAPGAAASWPRQPANSPRSTGSSSAVQWARPDRAIGAHVARVLGLAARPAFLHTSQSRPNTVLGRSSSAHGWGAGATNGIPSP